MSSTVSRRRILAGAVALPVTVLAGRTAVAAAGPMVDPADPTAKALGFIVDAAKVDAKTNPTFKAGQHCGNCVQFVGKPTDAQGGCNLFPGKQVPNKGWCRVWAAKPEAAAAQPAAAPKPATPAKPAAPAK
jgi:hypothetical protein